MSTLLKKALNDNQIKLKTTQIEKLELFLSLFIDKNSQINLSAIRTEEGIIYKHFIDALSILKYQDLSGKNILDIGSGGGFPGIPLAIALPTSKITLIDCKKKKIACLTEFADQLSLINVRAIWGRIEEQKRLPKVDVIVIRSVSYIDNLLLWIKRVFKPGVTLILYKQKSLTELEDLFKVIPKEKVEIIDYEIVGLDEDIERNYRIIKR